MFALRVSMPGLERLERYLHGLQQIDLTPLAERIAEILLPLNVEARLAGLDKDGEPLVEIKESTRQRRRRAGKGDGPPLDPDYGGSRVAADGSATVSHISDDHKQVTFTWPTADPWLRYHRYDAAMADGSIRPARDIAGLTPDMRLAIREATDQFLREAMQRSREQG